jgi:hypothetical protein
MHIWILAIALCAVGVIAFFLRARDGGTPSPECLEAVGIVMVAGGSLDEDDPSIADMGEGIQEALVRDYLSAGGAWSAGYRVTAKGRRRWQERAER